MNMVPTAFKLWPEVQREEKLRGGHCFKAASSDLQKAVGVTTPSCIHDIQIVPAGCAMQFLAACGFPVSSLEHVLIRHR